MRPLFIPVRPVRRELAYHLDLRDGAALQARIVELEELRDRCDADLAQATDQLEGARVLTHSGCSIAVLGLATVAFLPPLGTALLLGGAATAWAGGLLERRWRRSVTQCERDQVAVLAQKMNVVDLAIRANRKTT